MIDGIKFLIDPEAVREHDVLVFKSFGNRERAIYKGLIIDNYGHRCSVRGSIHKYSNEGIHNADDFTLSRFIDTLHDLCLTLNIEPNRCEFESIEFGVNLELPFDVKRLIDSVTYLRKGVIKNTGLGIEVGFSEYKVKAYRKSHIGEPDKLRYEIKINKKRRLRNLCKSSVSFCETLADLTHSKLWEAMGNELLSIFDDMLIVDEESINWRQLNEAELDLWLKGLKASSWLSKNLSSKQRSRQKDRFERLIKAHADYDIKKTTRALISDKIEALIDVNAQPIHSPNFDIHYNVEVSENHQWCKIADSCRMSQNPQRCKSNEINKVSINHPLDEWGNMDTNNRPDRVCEITNLSLDIGVEQSHYLNASGIEYYYNNHRRIYNEMLNIRLSERWKNEPLKVQFREIAHSIRNRKNNPKHDLLKSIKKRLKNGHTLFDMSEMIRSDKIWILKQNKSFFGNNLNSKP